MALSLLQVCALFSSSANLLGSWNVDRFMDADASRPAALCTVGGCDIVVSKLANASYAMTLIP